VDEATAVGNIEDVVWTVTLADGKYAFECAAHASVMNGWFTVGQVAPTSIAAGVGPKRNIALKPKTVEVGPATITVNDRSRGDNFHLTGPGVNRKTGVAFRGRVRWNVTLLPGVYSYRSDKHRPCAARWSSPFPPNDLHEPGTLAAGRADVRCRSRSAFSSAPKRSASAE